MNREKVERKPLWIGKGIAICTMIGILLLALSLRLSGLDAKSLWQDEIFTAAIASTQNSVSQVASIPLYNTALPAPPLYFLITHFFLYIGDNDFLLRLPSLFFGLLGVAMTYALGSRLFGRREGLSGALLLSLAPLHIRYSQDARFYSLLLFLSVCSLYFLWRGIFEKNAKWWVGFVVCSILNVYNQLFAFLVLLSQTVFVAGLWLAEVFLTMGRPVLAKREADLRKDLASFDRNVVWAFFGGLAIIGLAYLPMFPHLWRGLSGGKGLGGTATAGMSFALPVLIQVLDSWGLGSGWVILVLLIPFLIGIIVSARAQRTQLWLASCWLVVPFAALFAVSAKHGFRPRYVLFMLPLYLVFVARGLTAASRVIKVRLVRRSLWLRDIGLAVLLLAVAVSSVPSVQAYYGEDRANWKAVAALVARSMSTGDVVVSPGPFPQVVLPRYEESLEGAVFRIGGSEIFLSSNGEQQGGVWFVGPAREKMRAIDSELKGATSCFFKVVFEVDDQSAARGRGLKIAPAMYDDLWVLHVRGDLETEEVIQLYEEALEVVPSSTGFSIHVTLGDLYRLQGELERAMAHYQAATILDPYAPEPHYGLALVYEAQGLRQQSVSEWQTYEKLTAQ